MAMIDSVDFTRMCVQAIRVAMPQAEVQSTAPLMITVDLPSTDLSVVVSLGNAYRDFKNAPQNLTKILTDLLGSLMEPLSTASSIAQEDPQGAPILPVIRSAHYFLEIKERMRVRGLPAEKLSLVVEPLNEFLSVSYVFDLTNGMRSVTTCDFNDLGLDQAGLREVANENLACHFEECPLEIHRVSPEFGHHLYRVMADEVYESSLLVLDAFWAELDVPLRGDPVVLIPTRGSLMITGSQDHKDLATAREIARNEYSESAYPLDPSPYLLSKGGWVRMPGENLN